MNVTSPAKVASTILLVLISLILSGCFAAKPEDIQAFVKPHEVLVTADNYIALPPDELVVQASEYPEVDGLTQRVRQDGKISFEGVGEIHVAGKTLGEIAKLLEARLAELYVLSEENLAEHPIDVRVAVPLSHVYYVLGQVNAPGPRTCTGRDGLFTALSAAQPNAMAWEQRVQVIRPSADENVPPKIFEVDYEKMIVYGDLRKDVLLQEGDIVYVPPTVLAAAAMVIEEFVRPIARAFYGAYLVQNPPTGAERYYPAGGGRY